MQPTLKITVLRALFGSCLFCLNIRYNQKKGFLFPHIQKELGKEVNLGPLHFFLERMGNKGAKGGVFL